MISIRNIVFINKKWSEAKFSLCILAVSILYFCWNVLARLSAGFTGGLGTSSLFGNQPKTTATGNLFGNQAKPGLGTMLTGGGLGQVRNLTLTRKKF